MYDYLIIGQGIAGTTIAHQLLNKGHKILIIDDNPQTSSSKIASGLWNPIVLKRMKKVWHADEMLKELHPFYKDVEAKIGATIIDNNRIRRIFNNIEEQNNWFEQLDQPAFEGLLSAEVHHNTNPKLKAEYGLGEVIQSGRIDVNTYLAQSREYFITQRCYKEANILYHEIHAEDETISFHQYEAKHLIFCEGHQTRFNPWFSYLPFAPTKGEVQFVNSNELKLEHPVNGGKFILPISEDLYKIGATYDWDEMNEEPTESGSDQLKEGWEKISTAPFTIKKHQAGIRPNVKDRRPLLGTHPKHSNIHILNGLGSRGILMAPYLAKCLYNHLTDHSYLHPEMDIARFSDLLPQ